ncbi:hypothetical protein [Actinokineospora terrae]|uniref:DNA-3-methyladenine glycosylase II n=1 Tax=Actinokineospora terrae TaxID=155974 RepID=A0A1H9M963_9PSEU|nr:hypothetical protein [Actinokineospora terrae]SER20290.1 DNA-3-methyladenine glycosylase II [Actinokineospora terrae]
MPHATLMLDHPAWTTTPDGRCVRACRTGETVATVIGVPTETGHGHTVDLVAPGGAPTPVIDIVDPAGASGPEEIVAPLRADGPVGRVRNPDLWDALTTSAIRQVIRADQARKLHRGFREAHGLAVDTAAGRVFLMPDPDTVSALSDAEFARVGLKFFRRVLRACADWYRKCADDWAQMTAPELVTALQAVPRIGPWSAGATVADHTGDFTYYPHSDLAVRTWAAHLAPTHAWPDDDRGFAAHWRDITGDHLSDLTLLTLAWGVRHARGATA